ncbi:hypothetical protein [uncultured Ruminococcus sp.]|uniref:hypothetical protein n=1 Tax=uncultured Ruminococcus sp. TaxID=165186 RepID=UPI002638BA83|nr:hypothetical protein [uncultured Ruminococcus sp.]
MKTLRIKYVPPMIEAIAIFLAFGLFLVPLGLAGSEKMADYAFPGILAGMTAGILLIEVVGSTKTLIKLGDDGVIRCIWVFYSWKIDLAKVESFSYHIQSYYSRLGTRNMLDLTFSYKDEENADAHHFKSAIGKKEITELMAGRFEEFELMKIYRYAETLYPQKAEGYVEDSGFLNNMR